MNILTRQSYVEISDHLASAQGNLTNAVVMLDKLLYGTRCRVHFGKKEKGKRKKVSAIVATRKKKRH